MNDETFGAGSLSEVLLYRKAAIATVSVYLDMDPLFTDAVLDDRMDEFLSATLLQRESLKQARYADYLALLSAETIVRYAATAAEGLAADPDSVLATHRVRGDTGGLGAVDDRNAIARVYEILEHIEWPAHGDEAEQTMLGVKASLCNYYNACAYELVRGPLLGSIISVAESLFRGDPIDAASVRAIVIADQ